MKNTRFLLLSGFFFASILVGCSTEETAMPAPVVFEGSEKVTLTGYADHLMEPFLSRDGSLLIFNNSNEASANTNLHWATRVDDVTFEYKGEVIGLNTASLDGVPTMDKEGILYFVSLRDYGQSLSSIYESNFLNGTVSNISVTQGISKNLAGWVNFDVEVTADGQFLYFVDGRFDQAGGPYESDIVIAVKNNNTFQRLSNSDEILRNINTDQLEYAACISANHLELYFTRLEVPLSSLSPPEIFVSTRANPAEPFGIPSKINSANGFVEAATISPDGNTLYYHKKEDNGVLSLYLTRRVK